MHPLDKFRYCPVCGDKFDKSSWKSKKCVHCGFEYFINPSAANVAIIHNERGELLVTRRKNAPAQGTLDLPGGFCDLGETAEQSITREVKEEPGLKVTATRYLFSLPNTYCYSGLNIPTMDMFFACEVESTDNLLAADDAAECLWMNPEYIDPSLFGLHSISLGIKRYLNDIDLKTK